MQVIVRAKDGSDLWMIGRNGEQRLGVACRSYGKDGTQTKIVAVLTEALVQAQAELVLYEADAMPDPGATAAEMQNDIPVP